METLLTVGVYVYLAAVLLLMGGYVYLRVKRFKANREALRRRSKFQEVNNLVDDIARKHGR